jgi:hypothetical protein
MEDWSVADLSRYLERRGLGLRAIPTVPGGAGGNNAYLIRGDWSVAELEARIKHPRRVHLWAGVVYCERVKNPVTAEDRARDWEGACLWAAHFLFFGDPELLARIRDALRDLREKTPPAS